MRPAVLLLATPARVRAIGGGGGQVLLHEGAQLERRCQDDLLELPGVSVEHEVDQAGVHVERPDAAIRLAVNGELRQDGRTRDMIWTVPEIIAELSRYFGLLPGDLIFTGTPAGVGPLLPGDRVECRIDGVGELAFGLEPTTY